MTLPEMDGWGTGLPACSAGKAGHIRDAITTVFGDAMLGYLVPALADRLMHEPRARARDWQAAAAER